MKRKAQFIGKLIVLILALIVSGLILLFGYNLLTKSSETGCMARLALFEKDLIGDIENAYTRPGTVVEKEYSVPCGVERIYFVDKSKDVSFSPLSDYPEIMDSIEAETDKSIFLISGGRIYDSFSTGDLDIAYPYFDCYITTNGRLNIFLQGRNGKTGLLKKNSMFDCTFTEPLPVEMSPDDVNELFEEIGKDFDIIQDCDITRKITVKGEETIVTINNCDKNNLFFEKIPKCAVEVLSNLTDIGLAMDDAYIIEEDPLIMWNFEADEDISYTILKAIEENCKREFKGLAFDEQLQTDMVSTGLDCQYLYDLLKDIGGDLGGRFILAYDSISRGEMDDGEARLKDIINDPRVSSNDDLKKRLEDFFETLS